MTLSVSRSPGRVFWRISFNLCLPDVFLIIRPGFCVLEAKRHFHYILSRVHTTHMICLRWCWPWSCGGSNVRLLSACKVPLSPSCPLRRDVHSSQLRMGASSQPPRRESIYRNYMKDWSLLSHLLISPWIICLLFKVLGPIAHTTASGTEWVLHRVCWENEGIWSQWSGSLRNSYAETLGSNTTECGDIWSLGL